MAKKQKVVDLKSKPKKITEKQLNTMQSLISSINKIQFDIGQLEARKHELLHLHGETNAKIAELQKELKNQYGTIDVDIKDGSIKYEDESHN